MLDNRSRNGSKLKRDIAAYYRANGLLNNRILSALPDDDFEHLAGHMELAALSAGKDLYAADENSAYVYFPETAVVSHLSDLVNGNTVEIAMTGKEGATGFSEALSSQPTIYRAQVIIDGNAWRIKADLLRQEMTSGSGKLQTLLIDYLNTYLNYISQRVVCESFHLIENRFCSWLLMLNDRMEKSEFVLTQEQIAQFLGVNRPSISVVAHTLREEKLIDYARGKFFILDRDGLESRACECYPSVYKNFL